MNVPCKISVTSSRRLSVPMDLSSFFNEEDETWEEEADADDFPVDAVPSDRWKKPVPIPTEPPRTTTLLTAYGIFSRGEDGSFSVSYEDSEITGLEGCLTTFCLSPSGMLIMLRRGPVKTCMVFEKNRRHICDYGAGVGIHSVSLHTHELNTSMDENGGTIDVSYSVDAQGSCTERNRLLITVERS